MIENLIKTINSLANQFKNHLTEWDKNISHISEELLYHTELLSGLKLDIIVEPSTHTWYKIRELNNSIVIETTLASENPVKVLTTIARLVNISAELVKKNSEKPIITPYNYVEHKNNINILLYPEYVYTHIKFKQVDKFNPFDMPYNYQFWSILRECIIEIMKGEPNVMGGTYALMIGANGFNALLKQNTQVLSMLNIPGVPYKIIEKHPLVEERFKLFSTASYRDLLVIPK